MALPGPFSEPPPLFLCRKEFSGSRPKGQGLDGRNQPRVARLDPRLRVCRVLRTAPLWSGHGGPGSALRTGAGTGGEGRDRRWLCLSSLEGKPLFLQKPTVDLERVSLWNHSFLESHLVNSATGKNQSPETHHQLLGDSVSMWSLTQSTSSLERRCSTCFQRPSFSAWLFPETQLCSYSCSADFRRVL